MPTVTVLPPGSEEETPVVTSNVEQNVAQTTPSTGFQFTPEQQAAADAVTEAFRVPTEEPVSTSDLGATEDEVYQTRDTFADETQAEADRIRTERERLQSEIVSGVRSLAGRATRQLSLEEEAGVPGVREEVNFLQGEIADLEAELQRQLQRTDLGVTQRSILGEQARIETRYLTEIGAKSAKILVLQNQIEQAQKTAERTVELEFEPIENEITAKLQELEFKQDDLTEAEEKLQNQLIQRQTELEEQKAERGEIIGLALTALQNGADADLFEKILKSRDLESAALEGGAYLVEAATPDTQVVKLDNGNTVLIDKATGEIIKNLGGQSLSDVYGAGNGSVDSMVEAILSPYSGFTLEDVSTKDNLRGRVASQLNLRKQDALRSGDILGALEASAGGKSVDATFITSLEKAANVVGQLEQLTQAVDTEASGPILGVWRSNNPYDAKAQEIKALLSSIVPNLARGVYGEVGVLTDNDVRIYSRTLPNLQSTEEVRNAVLGLTVLSVQRSIENKLRFAAAGGRDVSAYKDSYVQLKALSDRLLQNAQPQDAEVAEVDEETVELRAKYGY